jgi:predicted PurR-regulated permease PerM
MLGLDSRAARAAWTVFLVALSLALVYLLRRVLLVFVLAVLFAYLLSPLVNLVDRLTRRRVSRNWALAAVYVALMAALVLLGAAVASQVGREAANLEKGFPDLLKRMEQTLEAPGPLWLAPAKRHLLELLRGGAPDLTKEALPLLEKATAHVVSVLSLALLVVLIPILAFLFLKDGPELRAGVLGLMSSERRAVWEDIFGDLHHLLGRFIGALVLLSLATLTAYGLFFTLIGMPYGVLLASVAAALEFIPVVGPAAAVVILALVAAFSGFGHVLLILAFLVGYRIFQDYILNPRLMSAGVSLHPLLVIFGALAGGQIAGIPGMFLSVPALATLRVIYVRVQKARLAAGAPDGTITAHG